MADYSPGNFLFTEGNKNEFSALQLSYCSCVCVCAHASVSVRQSSAVLVTSICLFFIRRSSEVELTALSTDGLGPGAHGTPVGHPDNTINNHTLITGALPAFSYCPAHIPPLLLPLLPPPPCTSSSNSSLISLLCVILFKMFNPKQPGLCDFLLHSSADAAVVFQQSHRTVEADSDPA